MILVTSYNDFDNTDYDDDYDALSVPLLPASSMI